MKKLLLFLFPFILFANLPLDNEVLTGKLDNGLTYYIRKNALPEKRAFAKLVVNVGSLDGTDDEVGIAHLIEHLALCQSENFSHYEIWKFLDSIGAPIGADANGLTYWFKTEYPLNLPLDKPGTLEKGILLLSDVAGRAKITEEVLESEKQVVLQELRQGSDHDRRNWDKFLRWYSNDTLAPSEQARCVTAATLKSCQEFYERYYTPDQMAIVVVGDIHPEEVLQLIEEKFSALKKGTLQRVERKDRSKQTQEKHFSYVHPDVSENIFSFETQPDCIPRICGESIKLRLYRNLFSSMLQERFTLLKQEEGTPLLSAKIYLSSQGYLDQKRGCLSIYFTPLQGQEITAMEKVYSLFQSALHGGFGKEALQKEVRVTIEGIEHVINNWQRKDSEFYADWYSEFFIEGQEPKDQLASMKLVLKLLKEFSYEEFSQTIEEDLGDLDFWLSHMGNKEINPEPLLAILRQAWNGNELGEVEHKSLSVQPEQEGEVAIDSFTLSNGMRIVLKRTDFVKNQIQLFGFAEGGSLSLSSEMYEAAKCAPAYQRDASFGGLKKTQLQNYLEKEKVSCNFSIDKNMRSFAGISFGENHEALFQMVYALFMQRNSDKKAFLRTLMRVREVQKLDEKSHEQKFYEKVISTFYCGHKLFQKADLTKVTQEDCEKVLSLSFGNPCEYTIIIVGDFQLEEIKELAKTYAASIPMKKLPYSLKPVKKLPSPKGVNQDYYYGGDEEHATSIVHISLNDKLREHKVPPYFFQKVINDALRDVFRIEKGISYSAGSFISEPLSPYKIGRRLGIAIPTSPEIVDQHILTLEEVFKRLRETPPTEEQIEGIKEEIRLSIRRGLEENQGWINHIYSYLVHNENLSTIGETSFLEKITPEKVHAAMKELLDFEDMSSITWMPASYEREQEKAG
ncbi:MAG: insulinase family protein [Chlamydiales bacterium]